MDTATRLHDYCDFVLGTLGRADQRRSGEVYVRGLLYCEGRRSIRNIAARIGGCSEQSLQQFVNQSPWDPHPVRQRTAAVLTAWVRPSAWVLDEVAFDKHGEQSAAVDRQFVPSQGRVRNCQLGAVAMLASETCAVAVDWRLSVPRSWDGDADRRRAAHLPDGERHQPFWRYQMEMLDDLCGDWGVPQAPVVIDARYCLAPDQLVAELESRGLDYLVRLSGDYTAQRRLVATTPQRPVHRVTVSWRPPAQAHSVRSQFAHVAVPAGRRSLLVEWRLGSPTPRGFWLTNMNDHPIGELARLV
ncbi:MAG TPA: transposase, partial [Pseudonocardiaceae bacterium]|nr:transposase [Pseudonocardiaceae bacterium]